MTITITIQTDNEAFQPDPAAEVARILNKYFVDPLDRVDLEYITGLKLRDINGNTVGSVSITD
jgi:hypothetical protein